MWSGSSARVAMEHKHLLPKLACSSRWEVGQTALVGLKSPKPTAFLTLLVRLNQIISLTWLLSRAPSEESR